MEEALTQIANVLQQLQSMQSKIVEKQNINQADLRGIHFQQFDESTETFDSYVQSCLGSKYYQILSNLTAPNLPKEQKYGELIDLLRTHISPKPSEIAEQHKFSVRLQHEGESSTNFQAELKKLTKNCNYFCENCKKPTLNTHLRSQFIEGVRDNEIRVRLLQQSTNITFEAVKLALAIESSKQEIHKQDNIKLKTSDTKSNSAKFKCFKCGKSNHKANERKAKNLHCETCGKSGHVKYVCFKTTRGKQNQLEEISEDPTKETIVEVQIEDKKCEMEVDTGAAVSTISLKQFKAKYAQKLIQPTSIEMEVDTGAAVSTISLKQFKAKYAQKLIQPTSILLRTYTGKVIKPVGKSRVKIKYENQTTDGDIYVLNGNMDTILGRDWLTKIKINWSQLHKLTTGSEDDYKSKMQNLLNKFDFLFTNELDKIYKRECKLQTTECTPIFMRPRPVPYSLKENANYKLRSVHRFSCGPDQFHIH
ncbi:Retroviral aspartyl protease [Popillia japonica]|uniref:Retroviral aspartyl protease n=1 Tax=Popillia japonica TaxID=7064 RepID=A0AAW1KMF8_POPJA